MSLLIGETFLINLLTMIQKYMKTLRTLLLVKDMTTQQAVY